MQRFFGLILLIFTTILMHAADVPDVGHDRDRFTCHILNNGKYLYNPHGLYIYDRVNGKSYGPFYGQGAEFMGYDRDFNPVFCIEDIALINLKGDCITVTGATIDTSNSFSPRGICIRDDFAVAYLPLDSLKWNTGITLDLTGWGIIEYEPFRKKIINETEIRLEVAAFNGNDLLRQNILYWLSEDIADEATWYIGDDIDWDSYYEMSDAYEEPTPEDICFIPSLSTTPQDICDYYGDFLINLFDVPEKNVITMTIMITMTMTMTILTITPVANLRPAQKSSRKATRLSPSNYIATVISAEDQASVTIYTP